MITPAWISRGEKYKSGNQCQGWKRTELTDWKAPAKLFLPEPSAPRGFSNPLLLPWPLHPHPPSARKPCAPLSAELAGQQRLHGSGSRADGGGSRLTFHAHAVIETFVVEAAVVGCAEMFPEVTASSWQHSKHMRSAKLSGSSPPAALQSPTGQEIHHMCGRPCPSRPSGVQGSGRNCCWMSWMASQRQVAET